MRARICRVVLPLAAVMAAVAPAVSAQQLSVERIFASRELATYGVDLSWEPDGRSFDVVAPTARGGTDLIIEQVATGEATRVVDGATLVPRGSGSPIPIQEHSWSSDHSKLLIFTNRQRVWRRYTRGTYYLYDVKTGALEPLSTRPGWQMFAKFSPDGSKVGFVRDNNLFVVDVASGRETQLTTDGSDVIVNGTSDWVYEEELDLRDAWRWSPDSKRIAFWHFDQTPVRTFYMLDDLPLYSEPIPLRYPKAGTPNSKVSIGCVELATGKITWMDGSVAQDGYLARMDFARSPTEVLIQRLDRHQDRLDVLIGDVTTGEINRLFSEADSAWVEVDDDLAWVAGGEQFLWTSERDGRNQIYLYNRDGSLERQLTKGDWDVQSISGVDRENGWVYFVAAAPSPMERQLMRVSLDGGDPQRITSQPGTHEITMSPDASAYLDEYSRAGTPPVYSLHEADGTMIRVLEDNEALTRTLDDIPLGNKAFFSFTTSDGVELNGWMIKPPDFDPNKKYPVLMYVYGGPGYQTVVDSWGGSRYLWHQMMAEKGYIVASVDGRGSGARGSDFKRAVDLDLGKWEAHDQIEAARYLGSLAYVDPGRIGIWGWSYGGYMTVLSLEKGGSVFRAGIAVAPVTDWRLYDSIYTERYMHSPSENPDGYRESSTLVNAPRLESALLIVHGTTDDNVHFQNSLQLANALELAGKQFSFMPYPSRRHSITGGDTPVHLYTLFTDWLVRNL